MSDLAAFLAARLDEDERLAKPFTGWEMPGHVVNLARLIREVSAKRAVVGWEEANGRGDDGYVVRALAAVYSDHPDYDPAWKPRLDSR